MRARAWLCVVLTLVGLGAVPWAGAQQAQVLKAQASNLDWLALMDAGKYREAWDSAAVVVRAAVTKEMWEQKMVAVRSPLGKVVTRELSDSKYTKTLPGVPDGEYVVTQYKVKFEHKEDAVETVVSSVEKDGSWRVAGYYFK
jgi:hypothetical protein